MVRSTARRRCASATPGASERGRRRSWSSFPGFVNAHSHGRGFTTYQMGQPDEPLEMRIIQMATRPEAGVPAAPGRRSNRRTTPIATRCTAAEADRGRRHQLAAQPHLRRRADRALRPPDQGRLARLSRTAACAAPSRSASATATRSTFMDDEEFIKLLPAELRAETGLKPIRCDMDFAQFHGLLRELAAEFPEVTRPSLGHGTRSGARTKPTPAARRVLGGRKAGRSTPTWSETRYQAGYARKAYGKSWAARLKDLGMLTERFSGAHGIWVDEADLKLIKASGAQIVHNPSSNLRLGSGMALLCDYRKHGHPAGVRAGQPEHERRRGHVPGPAPGTGGAEPARPGLGADSAATMFGMATHGGAAVTGTSRAPARWKSASRPTPCWFRWRSSRAATPTSRSPTLCSGAPRRYMC